MSMCERGRECVYECDRGVERREKGGEAYKVEWYLCVCVLVCSKEKRREDKRSTEK